MTLPVRKTLTSAGIAVLVLLMIADTSSAPVSIPVPEFVMSSHNAGSKVLAQSLRGDNQLGISLGSALERLEPSWTAERGGGVPKQGDEAQNAFLETWSTASATQLGNGGMGGHDAGMGGHYPGMGGHYPGIGGDYSNAGGGDSPAAAPFGWPGGLAGQGGPGISGPGRANGNGGSPKSGDDPVKVPEPTSLLLVVFGLATFGIFWMRAPELAKQRICRARR